MAFVSAVTGDDSTKKFMEVLQNDFKTLSLETKKKYPQIREVYIFTPKCFCFCKAFKAQFQLKTVECMKSYLKYKILSENLPQLFH